MPTIVQWGTGLHYPSQTRPNFNFNSTSLATWLKSGEAPCSRAKDEKSMELLTPGPVVVNGLKSINGEDIASMKKE